jgi:hypothetical protein
VAKALAEHLYSQPPIKTGFVDEQLIPPRSGFLYDSHEIFLEETQQ